MNELKVIPRHFGTIATTLDCSSNLPFGAKVAAIESWRDAANKVRVFSKPVPIGKGISFAKVVTEKPTLKAMLEDHYLGQRSGGVLLLAPPTIQIRPVCLELHQYAESKNMGISWAFYAGLQGSAYPIAFGLTTPVVKILAQEIPGDIYFDDGFWQEWLFKWIKKFMQAHRYFDATRFGLVEAWPTKNQIVLPTELIPAYIEKVEKEIGVIEPETVKTFTTPSPAPKKRGRPKKVVA